MNSRVDFKAKILLMLELKQPKEIVADEECVKSYVRHYNKKPETFIRYLYNLRLKQNSKDATRLNTSTNKKINTRKQKVKREVEEKPKEPTDTIDPEEARKEILGKSEHVKQDAMPFFYEGCSTEAEKLEAQANIDAGIKVASAMNNDVITTLREQFKATKDLKRVVLTALGHKTHLPSSIATSPFGRAYTAYLETVEAINKLDPVDLQVFTSDEGHEPKSLTHRISKRLDLLESALSYPITILDKLTDISFKSQKILQGVLVNDGTLRDLGVVSSSASDYKQLIIQEVDSEYESDPI